MFFLAFDVPCVRTVWLDDLGRLAKAIAYPRNEENLENPLLLLYQHFSKLS